MVEPPLGETPEKGSDDGRNGQGRCIGVYKQRGNVSKSSSSSDGLLSQHSHSVRQVGIKAEFVKEFVILEATGTWDFGNTPGALNARCLVRVETR